MSDLQPIEIGAATEAGTVEDLTRRSAGLQPEPLGGAPVMVKLRNDENVRVVHGEKYSETPYRMRGETVVDDLSSLVQLTSTYAHEGSRIFCDQDGVGGEFVLVSNYVDGWRDHVVRFPLVVDPIAARLVNINGKYLPQDEFGNLLEELADYVNDPAPADLIQTATQMKGAVKVEWGQGVNFGDGTVNFSYTTTATNTPTKVTADTEVELSVPIYKDSTPIVVIGRLRWRIPQNEREKLTLCLKFIDLDKRVDQAFGQRVADLVDNLSVEDVHCTVLRGRAPDPVKAL